MFIVVLPAPASAHPPQSVTLEYDVAAQRLNVSIAHVVADNTTHFVQTVEVKRNSVINITKTYTSQPTLDTFNYSYDISAVDGDVLDVTASCNLFGSLTRQLTVSSAPPPEFIPPTVHIISPTTGSVFNVSLINVSGDASDNVAVNYVEVSANNGSWQKATGNVTWNATVTLTAGSNFIRARAVDTSNNSNVDFVYVTYNNITPPGPDTTPPVITISQPSNGQTFNYSLIDVRGNASDASGIRKVEVQLNGGAWVNASGNTTWNTTVTLVLGSNSIKARATDLANNTNTTTISVTYENQSGPPPDTVPPSIIISTPTNSEAFETSPINVTGSAMDNVALSKVEVRVNKGAWRLATGTASWKLSVSLSNGTNQVDARATDTNNNQATASVNVTYTPAPPPPPPDNQPPTLTILSPAEGVMVNSVSLSVSGTSSDNIEVDSIEGRINGGSWRAAGGTTSWSISFTLSEADNEIDIRVTDTSNLTATARVNVTFIKVATTATLDGIVNIGEYKHTASLSGGDFTLSWTVKGQEIWMAIQGRTNGWVSIGLAPDGPMMNGADMLFGWASGSKAGMMDAYSTGETGPHPADTQMSPPGTNNILEYGCSDSSGTTTFEFKRLLKTGDRWDKDIPANGLLKFIWALGPNDNPNSKHVKLGYGSINITSGASTEQASTAWQPHAALMGTGMTLLLVGMFVARSRTKGWLKGHKALGGLGAVLSISGLLYGLYMIQASTGVHFRVPHTLIGVTTLLLVMVMPLLGLRMVALKKQGMGLRPAHRWLGRIAILMMLVTVISGLIQAGVIKP